MLQFIFVAYLVNAAAALSMLPQNFDLSNNMAVSEPWKISDPSFSEGSANGGAYLGNDIIGPQPGFDPSSNYPGQQVGGGFFGGSDPIAVANTPAKPGQQVGGPLFGNPEDMMFKPNNQQVGGPLFGGPDVMTMNGGANAGVVNAVPPGRPFPGASNAIPTANNNQQFLLSGKPRQPLLGNSNVGKVPPNHPQQAKLPQKARRDNKPTTKKPTTKRPPSPPPRSGGVVTHPIRPVSSQNSGQGIPMPQ